MYNYPYKLYAKEVLREITKSDDKEIICKFINELCRLSKDECYKHYIKPIKIKFDEVQHG